MRLGAAVNWLKTACCASSSLFSLQLRTRAHLTPFDRSPLLHAVLWRVLPILLSGLLLMLLPRKVVGVPGSVHKSGQSYQRFGVRLVSVGISMKSICLFVAGLHCILGSCLMVTRLWVSTSVSRSCRLCPIGAFGP